MPESATTCPVCGASLADAPPASADPELVGVLPAGTLLDGGSFSVGRMLGRGGFGITYLGADLGLKRAVAIKEFFPAGTTRHGRSASFAGVFSPGDVELAIEKFIQEARMLARFRHRSIVNVYEVFRENGTAYMVMEYLRGENLLERMERHGRALDERELLALGGPVSEALAEVHDAGVLHRDIKPENIMLIGPENATRPVLIDFGAAREFAGGIAQRHSIVLTPGYAPLEQYGEQTRRGPFTDVYALAATFYHVATGQQPPAATERALGVALKPPRELNPALSPSFDAALQRGMAMKVDERPQSTRAFYHELTGGAPVPQVAPARSPAPAMPDDGLPASSPPPSPAGRGHFGRVQAIAREIGRPGPIPEGRFVCPVCHGAAMFDSDHPITAVRCPVCSGATLEDRLPDSASIRCPSCRRSDLQPVALGGSLLGGLLRCPACRSGTVVGYAEPKGFIPDFRAECDHCGANFDYHTQDDSLTLEELPSGPGHLGRDWLGVTQSRAEWAALAGNEADAWVCPVCRSAFQACGEGRLEWVARDGAEERVPREHRRKCRGRAEWAKLAHQLPPDAGTIACPNCDAQFDETADERLTLLAARQDPRGVLAAHRGRSYPVAGWLQIAAGNPLPARAGLACPSCTAYLEATTRKGEPFRLTAFDPATDPYGTGGRYRGQALAARDWQRVAAGALPQAEDQRLREEARRELWLALLGAEFSLPVAAQSFPHTLLQGETVVVSFPATRVRNRIGGLFLEQDDGRVWVTTQQLVFQGEKDAVAVPLGQVARCELDRVPQSERPVVELVAADGSNLLRFLMTGTPLDISVDGLALQLPWDEQRFSELFATFQQRARAARPIP